MNHKKISKLLILVLLFQILACRNNQNSLQAKETILKENLERIREGIDKYYGDNQKYPATLKELVRHGYFETIPVDPITRRNDTWILVNSESGIQDIHSGAEGQALDGTPYSEL